MPPVRRRLTPRARPSGRPLSARGDALSHDSRPHAGAPALDDDTGRRGLIAALGGLPIGHGDDVGHAALRVTRFVQGYVGRASDEILTIAGEGTGHSNVTLHADDVRAVIEGFAMLRAAAADAHALLCAMQTQCAEPTLTGTLAEEVGALHESLAAAVLPSYGWPGQPDTDRQAPAMRPTDASDYDEASQKEAARFGAQPIGPR